MLSHTGTGFYSFEPIVKKEEDCTIPVNVQIQFVNASFPEKNNCLLKST